MLANNTLSKSEFFRQTNVLSYKCKCNVPQQDKTGILLKLYKLTGPMFKSNRIPRQVRDDFEQDSFLWMHRALKSFNPEKGSFISWLKGYIRAYSHYYYNRTAEIYEDSVIHNVAPDEDDCLLWQKIKDHLDNDEWNILLNVIENTERSKIKKEAVMTKVREFVLSIGVVDPRVTDPRVTSPL